jgi:FolB domain-containing protein
VPHEHGVRDGRLGAKYLGAIMDKVIIKDLVARGIIGVNDWEREKPQEILINITVFTDTRRAAKSDELADCVDYRALAKKVQVHAETAARLTVEALANDLADICLGEKGVERAIVRVEKPGAVRFSKSVGVEVERAKFPE